MKIRELARESWMKPRQTTAKARRGVRPWLDCSLDEAVYQGLISSGTKASFVAFSSTGSNRSVNCSTVAVLSAVT